MSDVFVSYSRKDKIFVQKLHDALQAQGRSGKVGRLNWSRASIPLMKTCCNNYKMTLTLRSRSTSLRLMSLVLRMRVIEVDHKCVVAR